MDRENERSAIGGDQSSKKGKFEYQQPKGRIFDQAQNFRKFVVVGEDADGQRHVLSSLDQPETADWLEQITTLEPTA